MARSRTPDEGAAAVEFALIASMLFLIVFAAIDLGLWAFARSQASAAARDATRVAMINPGTPGTYTSTSSMTAATQAIFNAAKARLGSVPPDLTVEVSCSDGTCTANGSTTVNVTVGWHREALTFVLSPVVGSGLNLSASSTRTLLGIPR